MKNTSGRKKYDEIAKDPRIARIRAASAEETEGDPVFVMVEFADGYTYRDEEKFLVVSVLELRGILTRLRRDPKLDLEDDGE